MSENEELGHCCYYGFSVLRKTFPVNFAADNAALMTTDDFLPILIFLIIKSEIPNW
jgi:hypothetical protein